MARYWLLGAWYTRHEAQLQYLQSGSLPNLTESMDAGDISSPVLATFEVATPYAAVGWSLACRRFNQTTAHAHANPCTAVFVPMTDDRVACMAKISVACDARSQCETKEFRISNTSWDHAPNPSSASAMLILASRVRR